MSYSDKFKPIFVDADKLHCYQEMVQVLGTNPVSDGQIDSAIKNEKRTRKRILVFSPKDDRYHAAYDHSPKDDVYHVVYGHLEWKYRESLGEQEISVYPLPDLTQGVEEALISLDLSQSAHAKGLAIKTLRESDNLEEFLGGVTDDKLSRLLGSPNAKTLSAWKCISDLSETDLKQIAPLTNDTRLQQGVACVDIEPRRKLLQVLEEQSNHLKRKLTLSMVKACKSNPNISIDELRNLYNRENIAMGDDIELDRFDPDVKDCWVSLSNKRNVNPLDLLNTLILEAGEKEGVLRIGVEPSAPKL